MVFFGLFICWNVSKKMRACIYDIRTALISWNWLKVWAYTHHRCRIMLFLVNDFAIEVSRPAGWTLRYASKCNFCRFGTFWNRFGREGAFSGGAEHLNTTLTMLWRWEVWRELAFLPIIDGLARHWHIRKVNLGAVLVRQCLFIVWVYYLESSKQVSTSLNHICQKCNIIWKDGFDESPELVGVRMNSDSK